MPARESSGPEFPELLAYLWHWFLEVIGGCAGGLGPAAITWADLHAWSEMTGSRPEPWETAALMRLSATYAAVRAEEQSKRTAGKNG